MILVVDMNWKRGSLAFNEFVPPIVSVVQPLEECVVKHFLDVKQAELESYSKIILSGTTLKDHATLKQIEKFDWIKNLWQTHFGNLCWDANNRFSFQCPLKGLPASRYG